MMGGLSMLQVVLLQIQGLLLLQVIIRRFILMTLMGGRVVIRLSLVIMFSMLIPGAHL